VGCTRIVSHTTHTHNRQNTLKMVVKSFERRGREPLACNHDFRRIVLSNLTIIDYGWLKLDSSNTPAVFKSDRESVCERESEGGESGWTVLRPRSSFVRLFVTARRRLDHHHCNHNRHHNHHHGNSCFHFYCHQDTLVALCESTHSTMTAKSRRST
jgi:hypothetical protein